MALAISIGPEIGWAAGPDPITDAQRFHWVVVRTIGPGSLATGMVISALGTASNDPAEYGPHWDGFAKRNGLRISSVATSNVMEAGLGRFWGEDPRYLPTSGKPISSRIGNVFKMTFLATSRQGKSRPAYARYVAYPASNLLSNTWRPDSRATANDALMRTSVAFLSRLGSNAFTEFWPSIRSHLFKTH
jgi:hypothetical protein